MNKSILLVFFFSVFFVLSFTSAGVFMNDEWMTGASLRQLSQGHQVVSNEGSYGYFANGTPSNYMVRRNNTLMYTLALPVASLPAMDIFGIFGDHFRLVIVLFWILSGLITIRLLQDSFVIKRRTILLGYASLGILSVLNLALYGDFPWYGAFVPREAAAIVATNVVLFGLFMVGAYLLTTRLWQDWKWRLLGTISVMCCSSLMFWVGTMKDHVLTATIVIFIAYFTLSFLEDMKNKHIVAASVLIGLLAWTRAEIAAGVAIVVLILVFYYSGLAKAALMVVATAVSSIPLLINDYLVSGNIFMTPFMVSNGNQFTVEYSVTNAWLSPAPRTDALYSIIYTIIKPTSGAVPLMTIMPLVILAAILIPYIVMKRVKVTKGDITLLSLSLGAMAYHIYTLNILWQQYDTGIFPDLRYYTPIYALLTLLALSVLSRTLTINASDAIRKVPVFALIITVLSTALIAVMPSALGQQGQFDTLITLVTLAAFAIVAMLLVVERREGKNYNSTIIAMLIVIPLVWVIITSFLYNTLKSSGYPQLLPVSEYIYNIIFKL